MNPVAHSNTVVGVGFASQADTFQRGREAAQMAKSQLPDTSANLVFAAGPPTPHFQDFVEGVRLVIGDAPMVAVPSSGIMLSGLQSHDACLVVMIHAQETRLTLAAAEGHEKESLAVATSLIGQLRAH